MGSVQSMEKCPKCTGVMVVDAYYKSGEESSFSTHCGYSRDFVMVRDNDGTPVIENGSWKYAETITEGYGAFHIRYANELGQVGGFNEPIPPKLIGSFIDMMDRPDVDAENSYLISFEDGKLIALFGEIPDLYSEEEESEEHYA